MTPLGAPPDDTHAARGLRAHDFVPTGERLLSEERLDLGAGGGARGVGTGPSRAGASRDLSAEMHTPDAARGLLLGRTTTIGASGDLNGDGAVIQCSRSSTYLHARPRDGRPSVRLVAAYQWLPCSMRRGRCR